MNFDEYQEEAYKTATYPDVMSNIVYPAMGLAGEAGELCDKIKKHWRNSNCKFNSLHAHLTEEQVEAIAFEIGDVLWYINALCMELGLSLDEVAQLNIKKLQDRRARDVIKSEGDNR
jgi:NTP pyrophosphatase (non-canonical NTP hydrolase)